MFCAQYGFWVPSAIGVFWLPESPSWLISKGYHDRAQRSLRSLGYAAEGDHALEKRVAVLKETLDKIRQETEGVTYLECFRKVSRKPTKHDSS